MEIEAQLKYHTILQSVQKKSPPDFILINHDVKYYCHFNVLAMSSQKFASLRSEPHRPQSMTLKTKYKLHFLQSVIDFFYGNPIIFTFTNYKEILILSNFFDSAYLKKISNTVSSFFDYCKTLLESDFNMIIPKEIDFFASFFHVFANNDLFNKLPFEVMKLILQSDELSIISEDFLVHWILFNYKDSKSKQKLLNFVNFQKVSSKGFKDIFTSLPNLDEIKDKMQKEFVKDPRKRNLSLERNKRYFDKPDFLNQKILNFDVTKIVELKQKKQNESEINDIHEHDGISYPKFSYSSPQKIPFNQKLIEYNQRPSSSNFHWQHENLNQSETASKESFCLQDNHSSSWDQSDNTLNTSMDIQKNPPSSSSLTKKEQNSKPSFPFKSNHSSSWNQGENTSNVSSDIQQKSPSSSWNKEEMTSNVSFPFKSNYSSSWNQGENTSNVSSDIHHKSTSSSWNKDEMTSNVSFPFKSNHSSSWNQGENNSNASFDIQKKSSSSRNQDENISNDSLDIQQESPSSSWNQGEMTSNTSLHFTPTKLDQEEEYSKFSLPPPSSQLQQHEIPNSAIQYQEHHSEEEIASSDASHGMSHSDSNQSESNSEEQESDDHNSETEKSHKDRQLKHILTDNEANKILFGSSDSDFDF